MGVNGTAILQTQKADGAWEIRGKTHGKGKNRELNELLWQIFGSRCYHLYKILGGNDRDRYPEVESICPARGWPQDAMDLFTGTHGDPHEVISFLYDGETCHTWFLFSELFERAEVKQWHGEDLDKILQLVGSSPEKTRVLLCWDY